MTRVTAERAAVSTLPSFSGDGYGWGGALKPKGPHDV